MGPGKTVQDRGGLGGWEGGKVPFTLPAGHFYCLDFISTGPRWHSSAKEAYSSSIT